MSAALAPDELPPASTGRLVLGAARVMGQALRGRVEVDPWGLDPEWFDLWAGAARVLLSLRVEGAEHVPDGPVLVVANRRIGTAEPAALAAAVQDLTGRRLRWAALADVGPLATAGRRLGGVLEQPAELAAVLRAGESVAVVAQRRLRPIGRVGAVSPVPISAAMAQDVPVLPVAVRGRPTGRRWVVRFGRPLATPGHRNPLAVVEHAGRVRSAIQDLLDG